MAKRESEVKVEVDETTALEGLERLPGVSRVDSRQPVRLEATYFDSPGLRLARAGVTLRRRTGGDDAGWHLKLPGEKSDERFEVHAADIGPATEVPHRLLDVLMAHRGSDTLAPVALVRTERRAHELLADDGAVLAEVADDRVRGHPLPDGDEVTWREVEVELVDGDEQLLEVAHDVLSDLDGAHEAGPAKLFRTLGEVPAAPGLAGPQDRTEPTAVLIQSRLGSQVDEVRHWDPLVRERLPGGVHQLRKAVRRLRDGLATARPFIDKAEVAAVRDELKWLSHAMADARDAEVQEARLRRHLEEVGAATGNSVEQLAGLSAVALRAARDTLFTDRYLGLLSRLDDLVASPPWRKGSQESIEDAYLPRVEHEWERLTRRMAAVDDTADPVARAAALHECRKATKRFRYAVEPLVPVIGKPAKRALKQARRLQKLLGAHHDAVVGRRTVQRLAVEAPAAENFALGRVRDLEATQLATLEDDVARAWRKASRKRGDGWFG